MCTEDGYPYCGSKYSGQNKASKNLCAGSVIDCVFEIDDQSDKEVFSDNWLPSLFLKVLKDQGIRATGTDRADRLGSLTINKSDVKNQERGTEKIFYEKKWDVCHHLE